MVPQIALAIYLILELCKNIGKIRNDSLPWARLYLIDL